MNNFSPEEVKTLKEIIQEKKNYILKELSQRKEISITDNNEYIIKVLQELIDIYGVEKVVDCFINETTVSYSDILNPIVNWYDSFDEYFEDWVLPVRKEITLDELLAIVEQILYLINQQKLNIKIRG